MTPGTTAPHHHHPHVTTVPNSHGHSQPLSTTYNHGTWPPTATWQRHVTSSNDHQDQQPQTTNNTQMTNNTQKWTWTTLLLTNNGQHLWTDTGDDEPRWDSLPPPSHSFLWHWIRVPHHWQWYGLNQFNHIKFDFCDFSIIHLCGHRFQSLRTAICN